MTLVLGDERCLRPSQLVLGKLGPIPKPDGKDPRGGTCPHTPNSGEEPAAMAEGPSGGLGAISPKGSSEGALAGEIYFCPGSLASSPRSPIAWETC